VRREPGHQNKTSVLQRKNGTMIYVHRVWSFGRAQFQGRNDISLCTTAHMMIHFRSCQSFVACSTDKKRALLFVFVCRALLPVCVIYLCAGVTEFHVCFCASQDLQRDNEVVARRHNESTVM